MESGGPQQSGQITLPLMKNWHKKVEARFYNIMAV